MADITWTDVSLRFVGVIFLGILTNNIARDLALKTHPKLSNSYSLASAESISSGTSTDSSQNNSKIEDLCADCRLASNSIEDLLRQPRQMNSYGQVDERIDLDKIKNAICKEISSDRERERCRSFYFSHLEIVEKWKRSSSRTHFLDFICIKELKYCCPRNSFGPKCGKCIDCGQNKHCHGEGTRSGSGNCVCKEGHTGSKCTSCLPGYYLERADPDAKADNSDTKKVLCKPCHKSCTNCRQEGPLGCEVCQSGYSWMPAYGCSDVDECIKSNNKICGVNTFCVNTEGSYFCYECDRACDGCHGDGPDMCLRCGKGYKLEKGNCVALKKTILPPEANYYRYAIYTGLCLCTCIILHNNVYLASIVGLGVALYVGFSEYIMSMHIHDMQGHST